MKIGVNVIGSERGPINAELRFPEGATVADLVARLRETNQLPRVFCDSRGPAGEREPNVLQGLLVIVNHINVNVLGGSGTTLRDGDRVMIVAAMAGG